MAEASLHGKAALVTGAGRGIGRAAALLLAQSDARVLLFDHSSEDLGETAAAIAADGGECGSCVGDVTEDAALEAAVTRCVQDFGGLDILVNAFSVTGKAGTLTDPDEAEWGRLMAVNLRAPRMLMALAARQMIAQGRGGRIVSVSSSSASRARGVGLAYGCSKAALEALTRIAAAQLAEHDINVNAVAPGVTDTQLQRGLRTPEQMQAAVSSGPLENLFHRVSVPEDVARAIVFLCGSGGRQITAQVIHTSAGVIV